VDAHRRSIESDSAAVVIDQPQALWPGKTSGIDSSPAKFTKGHRCHQNTGPSAYQRCKHEQKRKQIRRRSEEICRA